MSSSPFLRSALAWALLVGTRLQPGLAQLPRLALGGSAHVLDIWNATLDGRARGWRQWRAERGEAGRTVPPPPAAAR